MSILNPRFLLYLGLLPIAVPVAVGVSVVKVLTGRDLIEEAKPGIQKDEVPMFGQKCK